MEETRVCKERKYRLGGAYIGKDGNMDLSNITVQDCIDMFEKKQYVVLNDGKIVDFVEE